MGTRVPFWLHPKGSKKRKRLSFIARRGDQPPVRVAPQERKRVSFIARWGEQPPVRKKLECYSHRSSWSLSDNPQASCSGK